MANPFFRFKQFTICHDKCAMKVGTDGVLIGAWAEVKGAKRILDVGTGTGLIALMLAQRCEAMIHAIDIDEQAVEQARENVKRSPWPERVIVELQDIRTLAQVSYDVIVSNPPYFTEDVKAPERQRNTARHTDHLSFRELIKGVSDLLAEDGVFSVVLPAQVSTDFITLAAEKHLYLYRQLWVHTKPDAAPKRVLMAFTRKCGAATIVEHLTIELEGHIYSPEYIELTRDFYLMM